MLINYLVYFHEKYNAENLNKNPIKILIENHERLKQIFTIIWYLLSLVMLSGIWFGKK
jgi:hypothetical protein